MKEDKRPNILQDLPDRFELKRQGKLPEQGEVAIEMRKDRPEVRLKKWNGEVDLGVRYDKIAKAGIRGANNRMEWKDAKEELHAYPLEEGEGMEDGGLELEVLLKENPVTNKFDFQVEGAENLNFFYQPALTQEEIDEGASRPENVVGSYAVYHKAKHWHRKGSTNYATGKAFHIYRPKAIDANGAEEWAELSYENGVLSVTVPQSFLDSAAYPVVVDPTFGYESVGGSSQIHSSLARYTTAILSENGDITGVSVAHQVISDTDGGVAIYDAGAGGDLRTDSGGHTDTVTTASSLDFFEFAVSPAVSLTAADYQLGSESAGSNLRIRYDATGDSTRDNNVGDNAYNSWAATKADDTAEDRVYSIYATYTAAGGGGETTAVRDVIGSGIIPFAR